MKTLQLLLFLLLSLQASAYKLYITVEEAFTYDRIANASFLIQTESGEKLLYKSDEQGHILIPDIQGNITYMCTIDGHDFLTTSTIVDEDMEIKMILSDHYVTSLDESFNSLISASVRDQFTAKAIPNAKVKLGEEIVSTDMEGKLIIPKNFFQKLNPEEGDTFDLEISAPGYDTYRDEYRYAPAQLIGCFELNSGNNWDIAASKIINDPLEIQKLEEYAAIQQESSAKTTGCSIRTRTIKVGFSCNCYTAACSYIQNYDIDVYTQYGLDDEWIPSWHTNSLKAGSVAYRSYGGYHINHPKSSKVDIFSNTCSQVFKSSTSYPAVINACRATNGQYLEYGGQVARSEYASENNNLGRACGDGYFGRSGQYTSCVSDWVCKGSRYNGHSRGMCQYGSQRWAARGQSYTWILDHYYNPGKTTRCGSSPPPPPPSSGAPDLVIQALWTDPNTPCGKGATKLWVTVKNVGNKASNTVGYRRTINGSTAFTGTIPALNPGGSVSYYRTYYFPRSGTYNYGVYVNGASGETKTSNNSYQISKYVANCGSGKMDIDNPIVTDFKSIMGGNWEVSYNLNGLIFNDNKENNVKLKYYLSRDCKVSPDDILLQVDNYSPEMAMEDHDILGETPSFFDKYEQVPESELLQLDSRSTDLVMENQIKTNILVPYNIQGGNYFILIQAVNENTNAEAEENSTMKCLTVFVDADTKDENGLGNKVKISPNPTNGPLTISTMDDMSIVKVEIIDINGVIQLTKEASRINAIDISKLQSGIYLMKVLSNNDESASFRIIKD